MVTLTVYGLCLLPVFFCAKYVYQNWPAPPAPAPQKKPSGLSDHVFYPPGWEFLNPEYPEYTDFGGRIPGIQRLAEAAPPQPSEVQRDENEQKIMKREPIRYFVAKFPVDVTNTPSAPGLRRRSPLIKIYERNQDADAGSSAWTQNTQKPILEVLPPPKMDGDAPCDAAVSPPVGSRADGVSDHEALLRHIERLEMPQSDFGATSEDSILVEKTPPASGHDPPYLADSVEILRKFNLHAKNRLDRLEEEYHDYYCILYKWDQTNLVSRQRDVMHLFLREEPFSVYVRYEYPEKNRNREFIFWEGHYENTIIVNTGDAFNHRTLLLSRDSAAIQNSATHGVTELGFRELLKQLIEISDQKEVLEDAKLRYYGNAWVGDRACYALEVTFLEKRPELTFCRMEVMVDKELDLPVRVAMYDWSSTPGVPGEILEEYIYVIKGINIGLEDIDFCYLNSHYGFREFVPRLSQREKDFMKAVLEDYMKKR